MNYSIRIIKMTHFSVLIIIPHNIFLLGINAINKYIETIMKPYDEELEIEPHIVFTKQESQERYDKYRKQNESYQEYIERNYEMIDKEGNILSTYNKDALYDYYGNYYMDNDLELHDEISPRTTYKTKKDKNTSQYRLCVRVSEYYQKFLTNPEDFSRTYFIDKDGKVHKSCDVLWFGETTNDVSDWITKFGELLKAHNDTDTQTPYYVSILTCHI